MDGIRKTGAQKFITLLIGTVTAAMVTALSLLIFALIILKTELSSSGQEIEVICISVLSCFAGGFFCGKKNGARGFLWGLAVGVIYFTALLIIRLMNGQETASEGLPLFTTFLYCAGSGMLGGMVS
ncbi:MAG: TIGR04086 family membrane protein [Clostridiales bacterium]|nr:TIGR04086 family membrane protein [Clostridiales bacterium]